MPTRKIGELPKDLGIGVWLLMLGKVYSIAKRVIRPVETSGLSDYDVYYLVWPLPSDEVGDEKEQAS